MALLDTVHAVGILMPKCLFLPLGSQQCAKTSMRPALNRTAMSLSSTSRMAPCSLSQARCPNIWIMVGKKIIDDWQLSVQSSSCRMQVLSYFCALDLISPVYDDYPSRRSACWRQYHDDGTVYEPCGCWQSPVRFSAITYGQPDGRPSPSTKW